MRNISKDLLETCLFAEMQTLVSNNDPKQTENEAIQDFDRQIEQDEKSFILGYN
ncbi:hypothetical protein [Thalassotalea eurytherma]|uniref:Uncharacterized protein n=1 Tax=Thalassotalea eurytherma TaxID=1144278 RepID=A0ABQ6H1J8_9GAMM|nr:hypothetical protein [Thalassotalea eurytherma]GLX81457.1 hypothetical protein theurythT_09090 [Thalassotalea eurytherma]